MKKIYWIFGIIIILVIAFAFYIMFYPWKKSNSVYLQNYNVADDGEKVTIDVVNAQSLGYIKKNEVIDDKNGKLIVIFYMSYFNLKKKSGLTYSYDIPIDDSVSEIYFYRNNQNIERVLYRDDEGNWNK